MLKAIVLAATLLGAGAAHAEVPLDADTTTMPGATCGPVDVMTAVAAREFGERPIARGLSTAGMLITLFAAPHGETWSLLIVEPSGMACLLDAGEAWEPVPALQVAGQSS